MMFFVYILRCADGSYYVGSHRGYDVMVRVNEHNQGNNRASYTFRRRPVELVWSEDFNNPEDMIAAERRLKGWSRAKKEAYIRGDMERLKLLSVSKTTPADPTKSLYFKLTGAKRPNSS